jgi:hypothetical protein
MASRRSIAQSSLSGEENWEVRFHDEFLSEFEVWAEGVQDAVLSALGMLRRFGPTLGRPRVDTLKGSEYSNMKELRLDAEDGVWRIAFAFDPRRKAILLAGGSKTGLSRDRFYATLIHVADKRYRRHLKSIESERKKL